MGQQGLKEYAKYLEKDMRLPTNAKIEYQVKDKQLFKEFVASLDNVIDSDIVFNKIQFVDDCIKIEWKTAIQQTDTALISLECKEVKQGNNNDDDEKRQAMQW